MINATAMDAITNMIFPVLLILHSLRQIKMTDRLTPHCDFASISRSICFLNADLIDIDQQDEKRSHIEDASG